MAEVIVFADIEQLLIDAVTPLLAVLHGQPVGVSTKVPNPRPAAFVRVLRAGGARANLIQDQATVVYEAWAATEVAAAALAALTRGVILSLAGQVVGGVMVYRVDEFAAPQNRPDPDSAQPRYVGTVAITSRGRAL